jgi:hypothetical protein
METTWLCGVSNNGPKVGTDTPKVFPNLSIDSTTMDVFECNDKDNVDDEDCIIGDNIESEEPKQTFITFSMDDIFFGVNMKTFSKNIINIEK